MKLAQGSGVVIHFASPVMKLRTQYNYTRAELAEKRYALDLPTRKNMRARRLNATRRLGIESTEAERSPKAGYSTCMRY